MSRLSTTPTWFSQQTMRAPAPIPSVALPRPSSTGTRSSRRRLERGHVGSGGDIFHEVLRIALQAAQVAMGCRAGLEPEPVEKCFDRRASLSGLASFCR